MNQIFIIGLSEFFVWLLVLILGGQFISWLANQYDQYDAKWLPAFGVAVAISAELTWLILGIGLTFSFHC